MYFQTITENRILVSVILETEIVTQIKIFNKILQYNSDRITH